MAQKLYRLSVSTIKQCTKYLACKVPNIFMMGLLSFFFKIKYTILQVLCYLYMYQSNFCQIHVHVCVYSKICLNQIMNNLKIYLNHALFEVPSHNLNVFSTLVKTIRTNFIRSKTGSV